MPDTTFYANENKAWSEGIVLAGADEAGRGPLAGPVAAAAVIIEPGVFIEGVNDSKKLTPKKREALFELIKKNAICSVGIVDVEEIERLNILRAARLAFKKAVEGLSVKPDKLVCDYITGLDLEIPYEAFVKGDATIYSVAAASIIAKVTRDSLMLAYDKEYPEYGFGRHKGYGTAQHIAALKKYGPCPIHRLSFLGNILQ